MSARSSGIIVVPVPSDFVGESAASKDLKSYLVALYSYPDHFARKPRLSFQKHLLNVMCAETRRSSGSHVRFGG